MIKIKMVAFDERFSSYFILCKDGAYEYEDIPEELTKILSEGSTKRLSVEFVTLGPCGEFYIRFDKGNDFARGFDQHELKLWNEIKGGGREIRQVSWGAGGMIVRCN